MKNRRLNLIICVLAAIGGLLIWFYWPQKPEPIKSPPLVQANRPTPNPTPDTATKAVAGITPSQAEIKARKEAQIRAFYLTPISVYGKVVDESGKPIPGATVEIGIADKPLQTSSKYTQMTDGAGSFSLADVHGIAFSLRASKIGYYTVEESRGQRNVITPSNDDLPQPSKDQPVTLVLRKQGQTEPLIAMSSGQINVPKTGQPVSVDLANGRTGQGNLQVAAWLGDTSRRQFDWRYQVRVPGGGLIERKGQFDFEAPTDGYQPAAEINMPTTTEGWSSDVTKDYFAKLSDGRYARFSINFYPGQRNFVVIESYINPVVGSRKLEFDPQQIAKP